MKKDYNPWPCGPVPEEWQRPEIKELRNRGYDLDDMDIIAEFERKIATFAGSTYGVAISSCSNAIFLSLQYLKYVGELDDDAVITIPARTYLSVPMTIINAGCMVSFKDMQWSGLYQLEPTRVWDSSVRFTENMFVGGDALQCISFQYKKRLPIGRGGIVLTDDYDAVQWLRMARFNGRHLDIDQWHDVFEITGWNMYMTPDDAARGILIFDELPNVNPDSACQDNYPDLSEQPIFKQ